MDAGISTETQRTKAPAAQGKSRLLVASARGLAVFIGGFSLLNLLGELTNAGFDLNVWWIDFRPLPAVVSRLLLAACAVFLLAWAVRPKTGLWRRRVTLALTGVVLTFALWNTVHYYILLAGGAFATSVPVPLSLFVAASLDLTAYAIFKKAAGTSRRDYIIAAIVFGACMVLFPVAQMVCFGKTDYRRPADAIVVFGARVYADGRLSDALADRVRTGCRLYELGLAEKVVFSGGPGDGEVHETQAMRNFAVEMGVPEDAIMLDPNGVNTRETVSNTCELFEGMRIRRVLAVSHFFHLPRIKMSYASCGRDVYTVPARETYILTQMPYLIARETAALWVYYLHFIVG